MLITSKDEESWFFLEKVTMGDIWRHKKRILLVNWKEFKKPNLETNYDPQNFGGLRLDEWGILSSVDGSLTYSSASDSTTAFAGADGGAPVASPPAEVVEVAG